jgi:hypothetical protein
MVVMHTFIVVVVAHIALDSLLLEPCHELSVEAADHLVIGLVMVLVQCTKLVHVTSGSKCRGGDADLPNLAIGPFRGLAWGQMRQLYKVSNIHQLEHSRTVSCNTLANGESINLFNHVLHIL